jgi:hypothetical protein
VTGNTTDVPRRGWASPGVGGLAAGWAAVALLTALASWRALREPLAAAEPTPANLALTPGQDFRDALYFPIKEFLAGGNPYDPAAMFAHWPVRQEFDLYAPAHLVLHLPYALMPYHTALLVFSLCSVGYLLAIGLVSARVLHLPGGWLTAWLAAACVVLAQFGKAAVYLGQVEPLVGLGSVLALLFVGRSTGWSALGLALAWIKPQFGIPLTVVLLVRGGWRPAVLGTAGAGLVSLPVAVLLVVRAGGPSGFLDVIRANLAYATSTEYGAVGSSSGVRVDVVAVLFRLTGALPPGAEAVGLVVVLGLVGWLLSGRARRGTPFDARELLLASLGVLLCIVKQQGESLLTVPALVGVAGLLARGRRPQWPLLAATALAWVPVVHVGLVGRLLSQTVGDTIDHLVEGVSLIVALTLTTWLSIGHRNAPSEQSHVSGHRQPTTPDMMN